jgi:hypothetical protein
MKEPSAALACGIAPSPLQNKGAGRTHNCSPENSTHPHWSLAQSEFLGKFLMQGQAKRELEVSCNLPPQTEYKGHAWTKLSASRTRFAGSTDPPVQLIQRSSVLSEHTRQNSHWVGST